MSAPALTRRCARERCTRRQDPDRLDAYCSADCARINALIPDGPDRLQRDERARARAFRLPRSRVQAPPPRRAGRPAIRPALVVPEHACPTCGISVRHVHGPGSQVRAVLATPRAYGHTGTLVVRGNVVVAELGVGEVLEQGWAPYTYVLHEHVDLTRPRP